MRRALVTLLAVVCAIPVLAGCGKRETDNDRLREAIEETRRMSAQFNYQDIRADATTSVEGLIEDDFRFKARVFYDGEPGFDEVVSDDVLAMRVLDPSRLPDLIDVDMAATVDQSTEIKGVSVVQALKSKRWVQDPSGAPVVSGLGLGESTIGKDPAIDAVTVLDYTLEAMKQSDGARKYDPDTLSPTYRGNEDPFEKPKEGEIRYDLVKPRLPSPGESRSGSGGELVVPSTKHFRKLAVYVKDNKVLRIDERIEVTGRSVDDFIEWIDTFLREADNAAGREALKEVVDTTPRNELGDVLMGLLSRNLQSFGEPPILVRDMKYELSGLGEKLTVTLPEEQKVQGKLTAMVTSGASKKPKQAAPGSTAGAGGAGDAGTAGSTEPSAGDPGAADPGSAESGTGEADAGAGGAGAGDAGAGDAGSSGDAVGGSSSSAETAPAG